MNDQDSSPEVSSRWKDAGRRADRELRAFLETYDLRQYAREMQRLIELGLPTVATVARDRPRDGAKPSGEHDSAHAAEVLERVAEIAASLEQGASGSRAVAVAPTGLPRPASIVGRDRELAALAAQLRSGSSTAIFAIVGMGGVGKTALAAEVVARMSVDREAFPGGAAWIVAEGLEAAEGLAQLWVRVARAMSADDILASSGSESQRAALGALLVRRPRMLLALDNIEPALDIDDVLNTLAVPGHTAVLFTARQLMAVGRVSVLELAPLTEPEAVLLFTQRLRQIDSSRPMRDDRAAISSLVEAVGGLPLAIELIAAYAGVQRISLTRVLAELNAEGLNARAFHQDPRRTLTSAFDRTWNMLTPSQQQLFAGLSLVTGTSFPRDAALALAEAALASPSNNGAQRPADPEADVAPLVSYALVEPLAGERLRMHPLLREYAAQQLRALPSNTRDSLGDAMVAYWLAYAQSHPGYEGVDALEAEVGGLMGAITWAHEHGRFQQEITLARSVARAWDVRGRRADEIQMYGRALEAARVLGSSRDEQWALEQAAETYAQVGRLEEARAGYERALELARQLGDPAAERAALHGLAVLDARQGRLEEARAGYERALELARQLGDPDAEASELHSIAVLDAGQGRLQYARASYSRALALHRQVGDVRAEAYELHDLAVLDAQQGRLEEARAGYERALELARQLGDPAAERAELHSLARLAAGQGRLEEARAGYERALALARQLGDPAAERAEIHELAVLDAQQGRLEEARAGYERALELARQLGDPAAEQSQLRDLADLLRSTGELQQARDLLNHALAISQQLYVQFEIGVNHEFLARLDEQEGEREAAVAHYREALRLFEQLDSPLADEVREAIRRLGVSK